MNFIHIADMHFDAPFKLGEQNSNIGEKRRLEKREIFKKIVEYIKQNEIPYFFICGDLYEQEYIRKSTIDYINDLFKTIENCKVFIVPGNHDPYIKNSYYNSYNWNKNVHIFTNKLEVVHEKDVDIYGYGFNDFYMENPYENIEIEDKSKINILLTHGDIDNVQKEDKPYNELYTRDLKKLGFDYIALGHIHKKIIDDKIVYPGSTASMGFDEEGEHGMIVGSIERKVLQKEFVKVDPTEFKKYELDISNYNDEMQIEEAINSLKLDDSKYYEIVLVGSANFNINKNNILKVITADNILKIKNESKVRFNLEQIINEDTLRGIFARKILKKIDEAETEEEKEKYQKVLEEGLDSF
jgi:DNA repair exonuclease SbcCD nuclease subunit